MGGPYESYAQNPVLTNRNKAPYVIQGIGHGDLICDHFGEWHMLCLGFRQIDKWQPFYHLGREVFLLPVMFGADGWFTVGKDGTADESYEIRTAENVIQQLKKKVTFTNTEWDVDWCYLRCPHMENYKHGPKKLALYGTEVTLDETDSPTFIGIRQKDFDMELACRVSLMEAGTDQLSSDGEMEAGITIYMTEYEQKLAGVV